MPDGSAYSAGDARRCAGASVARTWKRTRSMTGGVPCPCVFSVEKRNDNGNKERKHQLRYGGSDREHQSRPFVEGLNPDGNFEVAFPIDPVAFFVGTPPPRSGRSSKRIRQRKPANLASVLLRRKVSSHPPWEDQDLWTDR